MSAMSPAETAPRRPRLGTTKLDGEPIDERSIFFPRLDAGVLPVTRAISLLTWDPIVVVRLSNTPALIQQRTRRMWAWREIKGRELRRARCREGTVFPNRILKRADLN